MDRKGPNGWKRKEMMDMIKNEKSYGQMKMMHLIGKNRELYCHYGPTFGRKHMTKIKVTVLMLHRRMYSIT